MKSDIIDEVVIDKKNLSKIQKPSMYNVIYLNDDYTTMEFVIWSLMKYFNKNEIDAAVITQDIHENGKGVAGTYSKEIAETKIYEVQNIARINDFPLVLIMEKSE